MNAIVDPPRRGRPRDPRAHRAIVDSTLELLAEVGYERMSVDAIATRAGVSKPTIYRRWPAKADLVVHALGSRKEERRGSWDTGSLRSDLLAAVREVTRSIRAESGLAAGLATAMRESEELARLMRDHVIEHDRRRYGEIVERARSRGELPAGAPTTSLFPDVVPSLVFTRLLVTHEPVGSRFANELVDRILLPILLNQTP
jgi:AcrR family transcriptional regulator